MPRQALGRTRNQHRRHVHLQRHDRATHASNASNPPGPVQTVKRDWRRADQPVSPRRAQLGAAPVGLPMRSAPTRRLLRLAAVPLSAAALAAPAAAAAKTPVPPQLSAVTIDGGHLASPTRLTTTGHLTCTKRARYHISAWILETGRGALATGSFPAKLPPNASKAAIDRGRSAALCTGAAQTWAVVALAAGAHTAGLTSGPANACIVITAARRHLYTLQTLCSQITLA